MDAATRLGLAWTSSVDHAMGLELQGSGLHPLLAAVLQRQGSATLEFTAPQQFALSATRRVSPDTLLAANIAWQQWSRFGQSRLTAGPTSAPMFEDGLRDTWGLAIGLRHRLDRRWTLATGLAYDRSPSPSGRMPIYFPVAEQWRVAAGADYQMNERLLLRLALSVVNQGDIRVGQDSYPMPLPGIPPLSGTIKGSRIGVLGLTVDFRP